MSLPSKPPSENGCWCGTIKVVVQISYTDHKWVCADVRPCPSWNSNFRLSKKNGIKFNILSDTLVIHSWFWVLSTGTWRYSTRRRTAWRLRSHSPLCRSSGCCRSSSLSRGPWRTRRTRTPSASTRFSSASPGALFLYCPFFALLVLLCAVSIVLTGVKHIRNA